jgi:hypothetical protein
MSRGVIKHQHFLNLKNPFTEKPLINNPKKQLTLQQTVAPGVNCRLRAVFQMQFA